MRQSKKKSKNIFASALIGAVIGGFFTGMDIKSASAGCTRLASSNYLKVYDCGDYWAYDYNNGEKITLIHKQSGDLSVY